MKGINDYYKKDNLNEDDDSEVESIHRNADKNEDYESILDHRNMDQVAI